jgi:hypothetical protein
MGYNFYITRAEEHRDTKGHEISVEEWLRIISEDHSLKLAGYNGPYFALWSGDEECGKSKYPDAWLNWKRGNIYSKSPDAPVQRKMVRLAEKIGVRVQGDDLEIYTWNDVMSKT